MNDSLASAPIGTGDTFNTTDLTTFTAVSLDAKLPGAILFATTGTGTKPTPLLLGQVTKANSLPVTLASDQGNLPVNVTQIGGAALAFGQSTMAGSIPVALASNQSSIPVTGSVTANAGTNLNTSLLALEAGGNLATIAGAITSSKMQTNLAQVGGSSIALGQTTMLASVPVVLASNQSTIVISGSVTANAGTNLNTSLLALEAGGNLATIAGAITSSKMQDNLAQVGGAAIALGQTTMSAGIPVTLASNQTAIPVSQSATWNIGTVTNLSQMSGVAISLNNGATDTGTQRVTISSDSTGQVKLATGANTFGQLTAHQSTNVDQIGGGSLALGQTTMSASIPVAFANNQSSLAVTGTFFQATQPVSLLQDSSPATQNITAADAATTTTTGANNQPFYTGIPTANSAASFAIVSLDTVFIQITGTWSATLQPEVSFDGGTTWFLRGVHQPGTNYSAGSVVGTGTAGNFAGTMNVAGCTNVRVRCTAFTSGTAVVFITKSLNHAEVYLVNNPKIADGTTPSQYLAVSSLGAALVNDAPVTGGGLSNSSFLSTGAVQATNVKNTAGMIYAIEFFNINATPVYVRLYNQTTTPASTDTANIIWRGTVPGNTAGAGFVKTWDKGLLFSTGIGFRCTNAIADNDTTVLVASTVMGNVEYK